MTEPKIAPLQICDLQICVQTKAGVSGEKHPVPEASLEKNGIIKTLNNDFYLCGFPAQRCGKQIRFFSPLNK